MAWKKYFKDANLSPLSGEKVPNFAKRNYSSYLPDVYTGHPNRIQRYFQYDQMDSDSEINAALDILAEFSTQQNKENETPFDIVFKDETTEHEIKLDWAMTSGEHLRPEIIKKFNNYYKMSSLNVVYGLTELSGRFCILNGKNLNNNEFTVGHPIDGLEYKIIDEDGKSLNTGDIGEVVAFGNYLMKGYLDENWTIPKNEINFFKTGDIGRRTKSGFLEILGRKDDVFKVSGDKVSSLLITDVLLEMNIFEDIFVKPVDDEILGKSPKIFYVLKNNFNFNQSEVLRYLKKKLPNYKVSYNFEKVSNIPRTGSGKVIRAKFKEHGK